MSTPRSSNGSGTGWIRWIEEVSGVNCRERSREELQETLTNTLSEAAAWV